MERSCARRVLGWMFLLSMAIALTAAGPYSTWGADAPVKKALAKRRGRLPAHYAAVVTEQQRDQIFKIEDDYRPKIEALSAQLNTLKKEQSDKIAAVLTPAQKKQVEEAAAKAKSNAAKAKSNAAKPAATTPAAPPKDAKPAQ
jgi:Spy/CpxP family protein refolding chaperone